MIPGISPMINKTMHEKHAASALSCHTLSPSFPHTLLRPPNFSDSRGNQIVALEQRGSKDYKKGWQVHRVTEGD